MKKTIILSTLILVGIITISQVKQKPSVDTNTVIHSEKHLTPPSPPPPPPPQAPKAPAPPTLPKQNQHLTKPEPPPPPPPPQIPMKKMEF